MRAAVLFIILFGGCGCMTTVTPPRNVADPVPAYLVDYGRHSSVMLRLDEKRVREYCFGDYNWFAINRNSQIDALRALFNSAGSTLGRRELEVPDDAMKINAQISAANVYRLIVSRQKSDELLQRLDGIFEREAESKTFNPVSEVWFVRTPDRYGAFHNCNHVTNRWLGSLGVKTRGGKMFARFKVKQ